LKPGHVYERFSLRDGREIVLRTLASADLSSAVRFVNTLVKERSTNRDLGILLDRRTSRAEERKWLSKRVRDIRDGKVISVVAFHGDRLVGNCEVIRSPFRDLRRCGTLGIAVISGYRGVGLGRRMLEVLLGEARRRGVSLIELRVLSMNRRATRLYRNLGFRKAGVVPRKILRGRRYIDEIQMYIERGENR